MILTNFQNRLRIRTLKRYDEFNAFHSETLDGGAAKRFGAIGSHLENLQRKGGFKGFNQKSVSVIISATDPRKQNAVHQAA
ncbi:MAG TPA: hypothetical protein DIT76_05750 [Spartobacteria bacterium]|nr:hypothetical protein [Spartobacteria bacterium]HCP91536.1 hypothetical protein [Spartobacteria bacterium]